MRKSALEETMMIVKDRAINLVFWRAIKAFQKILLQPSKHITIINFHITYCKPTLKGILFLGLVILFLVSCDQSNYDTLENFDKAEVRGDSLYSIGDSLYFDGKYSFAIDFYQKSIPLFFYNKKKLSNATNDIGLCYKKLGVYDSAKYYYSRALEIDLMQQDSSLIAGRLRNLGNLEKNFGHFAKAATYYVEALKYEEKSKYGSIFNSLGNLNEELENFDEALGYLMQAKLMYTKSGDSVKLGYVYNNIGLVYFGLDQLDSALYNYYRAMEMKQLYDPQSLPSTYLNIGEALLRQNRLDVAKKYLTKSLNSTNNENLLIIQNLLARLYLELSDLNKARVFLDNTYNKALSDNDTRALIPNLRLTSTYYYRLGQYNKAYEYLKRWSHLRDSLFNEEKIKNLKIITDYEKSQIESEKRAAEKAVSDAVMEAELEKSRADVALFIAIILFLLFSLIVVSLYLVLKQRSKLRKQAIELRIKKAKIEALNRQNIHFTKNSLSEIIGLLNLENKGLSSEVRQIILSQKLRIETISILFNYLFEYGNDQKNSILLKDYLARIIENTFDALLEKRDQVKLILEIDDISVDENLAMCIGIILNEFCVNACKYAFGKDRLGVFSVQVKRVNGLLNIHVYDNGPGLPDTFEVLAAKSFGFKLINLLCQDIDAKLSVLSIDKGSNFSIKIPFKLVA